MNILSTDQPPLVPLSVTSTDQPPSQQTQRYLLALKTGAALATPDFWQVRQLMDEGQIEPVRASRQKPYQATPQQQANKRLLTQHSPDVMVMLAAGDFWAATRLTGAAWTAGAGIPSSSLSIEPLGHHGFEPVSATDYTASVARVPDTMNKAPLNIRQLVTAQSNVPFLFLPIALGMADDPGAYPHSCLLVDCVHAVVNVAVHRLKHRLLVPRPYDEDAFPNNGVSPLIRKPGYTAYPSGHATLMFALATVLAEVIEAEALQRGQLESLAAEIATNRERAGLHTELDTRAGRDLGRAIGGWMVAAAAHSEFGPWSAIYASACAEW